MLPLPKKRRKVKNNRKTRLKTEPVVFEPPYPLRKPPRLEGKVQNRGIKKVKK